MSERDFTSAPTDAPPRSFVHYLRSLGPGLIVVMTWLGAGDIVEVSVAGGNYGYSLMWVMVLAVIMRFLFVSVIAKYQLCNQHGEGVLDGLARLHRWYSPLLLLAAIVMGHIYCAYMTVGLGEACVNLFGRGSVWQWAIVWNAVALVIVFRPVYGQIEVVFKVFVGLLAVSFLGTALWVGPNPAAIARGTFMFALPERAGEYDPLLIVIGMIGAVGGSLMNLVYPYFLEEKGWTRPQHRRLQMYDFFLAVVVMIVLDMAIWTLGAELLHPRGLTVTTLEDLPRLLSEVLGSSGRVLFYVGIFAAIFTSLVGHALGLARMGSHAYLRSEHGPNTGPLDYRSHWTYRAIVLWCLISSLYWTLPGNADFVYLTLIGNSAQVVLVPVIAGGLWWITANSRYIGSKYCNRWWENAVMAVLFLLAIWGAVGAVRSVLSAMGSG